MILNNERNYNKSHAYSNGDKVKKRESFLRMAKQKVSPIVIQVTNINLSNSHFVRTKAV